MKDNTEPVYDLEERLLDYAARIIKLTQAMGREYAEMHIAKQLLRSGTAPLSHHGEAQAAESNKDFIHKMSLGLKELRESRRWIRLLIHAELVPQGRDLDPLLDETEQLIKIFFTSIVTARSHSNNPPAPPTDT